MDTTDLANRFRFHPAATDERRDQYEHVRTSLAATAMHFNETLPEGREKSVVMTKLEEVMFWANAAIARQGS